MVKIVIDAGHGINTPGKRSPADEREWSFNDKVADACIARLAQYNNAQMLRVDDATGRTDVSLRDRTNRANAWKADVYVSIHHNALVGKWGVHGGVETFTNNAPGSNPKSVAIAKAVHPRIVSAMGLRDRGIKTANLHVLRNTNMPAILTEGGFMDSTVDIAALRSDDKLRAQGVAIADGLASYFGLKLKVADKVPAVTPVAPTPIQKEVDHMAELLPKTQKDDMRALLQRAYDGEVFTVNHSSKADSMTRGQALDLLISYTARTNK